MVRTFVWLGICLTFAGCSPKHSDRSAEASDLSLIFGRIWKVSGASQSSPPGSLYVFLANGTLLETSCVETYRIASWTIDPATPRLLHVVEDKQPAFTAAITELSEDKLNLHLTLTRSKESRDLTLQAVREEFVCPDLPK